MDFKELAETPGVYGCRALRGEGTLVNRFWKTTLPVFFLLLVPTISSAQTQAIEQDLTTLLQDVRTQAEHRRALGVEIERLFREDQADGPPNLMPEPQRQAWLVAHEKRILRMREIVRTEPLDTLPDLFNAAALLQHGIAPEDFLTAHVLFSTAALKGSMAARGLAAAALDRFLLWIDRPAIFIMTLGGPNRLTDDLRKFHCILPVAKQHDDASARPQECTPTIFDFYNDGRPTARPNP